MPEPVHKTDVFPRSVFQLKSIFISSCVRYDYKDRSYNRFYALSQPISSLGAVGQTIDELLQAVKLNSTPSTGEGLLRQHEMTHGRTGSISHICELNPHNAQFQNTIPNLYVQSPRARIRRTLHTQFMLL